MTEMPAKATEQVKMSFDLNTHTFNVYSKVALKEFS